MKNKFIILILIFVTISLTPSKSFSENLFNFNVTEIEITENGNLFKGFGGGEAISNDGIKIKANTFEYNKKLNSLFAKENVELNDTNKKIFINADEISYFKNIENIIGEGSVELKDKNKNIHITARKISYLKNEETILAEGNVIINDLNQNTEIFAEKIFYSKRLQKIKSSQNVVYKNKNKNVVIKSDEIIYFKNEGKILTRGPTKANVDSRYKFNSSNIIFEKNQMRLISSYKTTIDDSNNSRYELGSFEYQIENEFLKAVDLTIIENSNLSPGETNKYYFANGFFDLKNKNFKTGPAKILLKKDTFGRKNNDPRIYGIESSHKDGITSFKKASFTSCRKNNTCPPWRIEAKEIKHDKNKKRIIYDESVLKLYNLPVFYFPKFFHPDPTVKRQTGFLLPKLNNSNVLGSSLSVPYFHIISNDKDLTFNPILFSKNTKMLQTEYRQEFKNSSLITDFGITNGYKSSTTHKSKNINHFFGKLQKKLKLKNFFKSDFNFFIERVSKDTYLKIFQDNLSHSKIKPANPDLLNSGFDFELENKKFYVTGGANVYENLTKLQSDRYQYVLPYYDLTYNPILTNYGTVNLTSNGNNIIDNTNNQKSRIINNINFKTNDKIFENFGIKNNFNLYLKNLNSIGKNVSNYKSSPQIELQSLFEFNSELPLIKKFNQDLEIIIPRLSLRINPGDMKNHSDAERKINTENIFDINRLGINDSFETGNSLTFGIDYKKENIENEKYFELKLSSVFRDNEEENIPNQTSLNKKNSDLFGSMDYKFSEILSIDYNFAVDNKIERFNYNSIGLNLSLNNFVTEFNFIEEDSLTGNTNIFENTSTYNFNNQNSIKFQTRRNREVDLTEYYNLVYEYKNDCLTAGLKFNKTYYEDRDLKPSENIMFTISFYPITSVDQKFK